MVSLCLRKPACVVLSMERVSVISHSVGDESCPELVKSVCKAEQAIWGHLISSPLFLSIRMVLLAFQDFGVKPAVHIRMRRTCIVFWTYAGSMRRNSLTIAPIWSWIFIRVLMHSLKALLSSIDECIQFLFLVPSDSCGVIFDCSLKGSGIPGSFSACSQK